MRYGEAFKTVGREVRKGLVGGLASVWKGVKRGFGSKNDEDYLPDEIPEEYKGIYQAASRPIPNPNAMPPGTPLKERINARIRRFKGDLGQWKARRKNERHTRDFLVEAAGRNATGNSLRDRYRRWQGDRARPRVERRQAKQRAQFERLSGQPPEEQFYMPSAFGDSDITRSMPSYNVERENRR
jgi:hypothetical protein